MTNNPKIAKLMQDHGFDELTAWRHLRDQAIARRRYEYQRHAYQRHAYQRHAYQRGEQEPEA